MADLTFEVPPLALADALYNAVEMGKDALGRPGCPHVLICYQQDAGEAATGAVLVYGASRIVAGRTTIRLETLAPEDHVSVAISRDNADKIQSALRGYGRGKAARVSVRICEEGYDAVSWDEEEPLVHSVNFSICKEYEEPLAELADSDPGGKYAKHFDIVDDYLIGSGATLAGPTAFIFEAVKRVTNLKGLGATALDLAQTTHPQVIAIAAGANFRGILGELDRNDYAGPDGARASHLLN